MQIYFHPKSVRIPDFPSDYSHILTHPPHILYLLTMCRAYDPLQKNQWMALKSEILSMTGCN